MGFKFFRALMFVLLSAVAGMAAAADKQFGPFKIAEADPTVIRLDGEIDVGAALNFRRALRAAPNAKIVSLNSPGGTVQMGLLIADDVQQWKLSTYVPKGSGCYSACAYIFLAGKDRQVDGELGVHQISSDATDLVGAQMAIGDIIEMLDSFGVSADVLSVMFKTPPNQMHVFTAEEISELKINRRGESGIAPEAVQAASVGSAAQAPLVSAPEKSIASLGPQPLSDLYTYVKRPTRIAVFAGLDFFGADIASFNVADAGTCASKCFEMNGQCKAFTFNTTWVKATSPNCFLKASEGRADANSAAFSGRFLGGTDVDPQPFTMNAIDLKADLLENTDLQGGDLSKRPWPNIKAAIDCRLACIDNDRCTAFTFIKRKHECWLKSMPGFAVAKPGMISGRKSTRVFAPSKIISIQP